MYSACMTNVQIRDVPDDVHRVLARRAKLAGQSLQQYLSSQLASLAATPTLDEVLERSSKRHKAQLSSDDIAAALEAERAGR